MTVYVEKEGEGYGLHVSGILGQSIECGVCVKVLKVKTNEEKIVLCEQMALAIHGRNESGERTA